MTDASFPSAPLASAPLQCVCGNVRGHLLLRAPLFRVVCHCRWCVAYARFTGHESVLLDEYDGTHVYQVSPAQIRIEAGDDALACVRLSPKGTLRWHTACCKTPLGNGLESPRIPWIGLPHLLLDAQATSPQTHAARGPVRYRVNAGDRAARIPGAHKAGPLGLVGRAIALAVSNALRGAHRPSPFHNESGTPRCSVDLFTQAERQAHGL